MNNVAAEDIAKGGISIVKRLIPPIDGDPWHRFRYDATVSLALIGGGILGGFHVLWVCGLLSFVGLPQPYASASEVQQYGSVIVSIQAGQLQDKIREAKRQVCIAIQAKNQGALEAWARELEGLKQSYRDNIHREPQVMGCDELLIGGTQG